MRTWAVAIIAALTRAAGQELLAANSLHPAAVAERSFIDPTLAAGPTSGSSPRPSPLNVTGTYKGSWQKLKYASSYTTARPLLERDAGSMFYRIAASNVSTDTGVHDVEGELVVRDGELHSSDDLTLRLGGVFVAATSRVHAVLQPTSAAAATALHPRDVQDRTAAYRKILRSIATERHGALQPSGVTAEEVLEMLLLRKLQDPGQKECEFVLDMRVQTSQTRVDWTDATATGLHELTSPQAAGFGAGADGLVVMNGTLHSSTCGFALSLNASSTNLDVYYAKAVRYTLMITTLSFIQILLLLPQIEAANTPVLISKVSMLTIGQQAIMDAYLCLLHLTTGIMVDPLFNSFAVAAFLEFVIFAIFEMRILLMIWRVRRAGAADPWAQQRELSVLYARFYSALLGGIFISYQMQRWMKAIVFVVFSFWIPQIALCAYHDARQPLRPYFVVGMSVTRLALPLYLYGCPSNLLRNPTSAVLCWLLCAYVTGQVLLLLGQSYYGSRFFVPKRFLPPKYDYFRPTTRKVEPAPADIETGDAGVECVICMNSVDVLEPRARMLTPCNHVFHTPCLQRWMDVKMECPTCRAPLPPS